VPRQRTTFRFDKGRLLLQGHGVTPEVWADLRPKSRDEQEFLATAEAHPQPYRDAVTAVALHLLRSETVGDQSLIVTPRMRAMLFQRLQGSGMPVRSDGYFGAAAVIDYDLGRELTRQALGEPAALRWQLSRDPPFLAGVNWLRRLAADQADTAGRGPTQLIESGKDKSAGRRLPQTLQP
jgi:hypothetical protein